MNTGISCDKIAIKSGMANELMLINRQLGLTILLSLMLQGCGVQRAPVGRTTPPSETPERTVELSPVPMDPGQLFPEGARFAYLGAGGNHLYKGEIPIQDLEPIKIQLPFQPAWLLGIEMHEGTGWIAIADSGEIAAFQTVGRVSNHLDPGIDTLEPGAQPSFYFDGERLGLVTTGLPDESVLSPPVYLPKSQAIAALDTTGNLVVQSSAGVQRIALEALPDARILSDDQDRILLLGGRTNRYSHGVLGDAFEASALYLVRTLPNLSVLTKIELPSHEVFEGISPIWVDFNGDGEKEILVTISDQDEGAYLALYAEDGRRLARSGAIGRSYRWRHQISAAGFLDASSVEIASVLTPHIGGVLQYFSWEGEDLVLQAEAAGVSSHQIGSRNLDMALAGDLNADGRVELLVPNTSYSVLGLFGRDQAGIQLIWEYPLVGVLSTNIAGLRLEGGGLAIGLGLEDGRVLLWIADTG